MKISKESIDSIHLYRGSSSIILKNGTLIVISYDNEYIWDANARKNIFSLDLDGYIIENPSFEGVDEIENKLKQLGGISV